MTKCILPISELPIVTPLVKDYLSQNPALRDLFQFAPNEDGLLQSIASKSLNYTKRSVLSTIVKYNYPNSALLSDKERRNLSELDGSGLAVTTAHQPNLFLGPLYTLTKAISTISLANHLNAIQTKCHIVPIFIIGSEDHDKEELLHTNLFGNRYEWHTEQIGSVGKMVIDDTLVELRDDYTSKFGEGKFGTALRKIYTDSYSKGQTLSEGFGNVLRKLLGPFGIIVLDMNIPEVKHEMSALFLKELESSFALKTSQKTMSFLSSNYAVQAPPTDINLFEYRNGERQKIKQSTPELIERLKANPELFSPSVILRPVMQQMMIPSIANIGGGAEVSYWLELRAIFEAENIDFPVIIMRDILSPLDGKAYRKWTENGLNAQDFFLDIELLKKKIVMQSSDIDADFERYGIEMEKLFERVENSISNTDKTLAGMVKAEAIKAGKSLELIYGKAIKSMKRNDETKLMGLEKVKNKVFRNGLVEREENFAAYYIQYGDDWIRDMIDTSNPLANNWMLDIRDENDSTPVAKE